MKKSSGKDGKGGDAMSTKMRTKTQMAAAKADSWRKSNKDPRGMSKDCKGK